VWLLRDQHELNMSHGGENDYNYHNLWSPMCRLMSRTFFSLIDQFSSSHCFSYNYYAKYLKV
jgi:hypothetical protein